LLIIGVPVVALAALVIAVSFRPPGPPELVVTGTVTDAATGNPIAGARVFDDGYGPAPPWDEIRPGDRAPWGAVTDSQGRYSFLTWPEHHSVRAEAPGYTSQRKTLYEGHFVLRKKPEEVIVFELQAD
ncbi:MAG: carboxypeptidase-like regulatory domain-containing protein, partial [Planctomycetota bacterium]